MKLSPLVLLALVVLSTGGCDSGTNVARNAYVISPDFRQGIVNGAPVVFEVAVNSADGAGQTARISCSGPSGVVEPIAPRDTGAATYNVGPARIEVDADLDGLGANIDDLQFSFRCLSAGPSAYTCSGMRRIGGDTTGELRGTSPIQIMCSDAVDAGPPPDGGPDGGPEVDAGGGTPRTGGFYAVDNDGGVWFYSPTDGWVPVPTTMTNGFLNRIWRGGSHMGVGGLFAGSNPGFAIYSADGVTWTDVSPPQALTPMMLTHVVFGAGRYVASGGANVIVTPDNGATWTAASPGPTQGEALAFGDGMFVNTAGERSADGAAWAAPTTPPSAADAMSAVGFGGGRFVTMGRSFAMFASFVSSSDDGGATWAAGAPGPGMGDPRGVAYDGTTWVAVGTGALLWRSSDGQTFEAADAPGISSNLNDVAFAMGQGFLAVGDDAWASADGVTWTAVTLPPALQTIGLASVAASD